MITFVKFFLTAIITKSRKTESGIAVIDTSLLLLTNVAGIRILGKRHSTYMERKRAIPAFNYLRN